MSHFCLHFLTHEFQSVEYWWQCPDEWWSLSIVCVQVLANNVLAGCNLKQKCDEKCQFQVELLLHRQSQWIIYILHWRKWHIAYNSQCVRLTGIFCTLKMWIEQCQGVDSNLQCRFDNFDFWCKCLLITIHFAIMKSLRITSRPRATIENANIRSVEAILKC